MDGGDRISIHALREEGDLFEDFSKEKSKGFLSTPSARRATWSREDMQNECNISIHALREEGDCTGENRRTCRK